MRIFIFLLPCLLLFKEVTRAEEVEVVEAIPGEENRNENAPLNRQEAADVETSNELSMDTLGDSDSGGMSSNSNSVNNVNNNNNNNHRGQPIPPPSTPNRANTPSHFLNRPMGYHNVAYHGPPPPLPGKVQLDSIDKIYSTGPGPNDRIDNWSTAVLDMPKIISLDVKCEKNLMKVYLSFDKPFYGIIFSKGHFSNINCIHLPAGLGRSSVNFEISIHACGTAGNTENGLYGFGLDSGSGTYFENIIVIQYDPQVQEVWDQARKLRCTWHDLYEKSVTFRPFPVDMLDVVRADFAGDNVGCWMQIQVGKGPWASEVSGLVKIGQTMTMVLAIKDDDAKFDMLVRNCMAHDGKRAPIQLVDQKGCIIRPKLISRFTKIKNFGASASVLSYAHFQAFKFPDSMEVHFQCTIQICRYHCPNQCAEQSSLLDVEHHLRQPDTAYGIVPQLHLPLEAYVQPRDERRRKARHVTKTPPEKSIGVNRVIRVVSSGDLTFPIDEAGDDLQESTMVFPVNESTGLNVICITTSGFTVTLLLLLVVLITSSGLSIYFCVKVRNQRMKKSKSLAVYDSQSCSKKTSTNGCFYSS